MSSHRKPVKTGRANDGAGSARTKFVYTALGTIFPITIGTVLQQTWAAPEQYLRLAPVHEPEMAQGNSPVAVRTDTVIWRAENWGSKSLEPLIIRIGNPACRARIVDGFVNQESAAIVAISMSRLYPEDATDQNVLELTVGSWPREGALAVGTVFQGAGEPDCFTARLVGASENDALIVTRAPRLWVAIRATPLLGASLVAGILFAFLAAAYPYFPKRGG